MFSAFISASRRLTGRQTTPATKSDDNPKEGFGGDLEALEGTVEGTVTVVNDTLLAVTKFIILDVGKRDLEWRAGGETIVDDKIDEPIQEPIRLNLSLKSGKTVRDFDSIALFSPNQGENGTTFATATISEGGGDPSVFDNEDTGGGGDDSDTDDSGGGCC